jgi:peptide deformylase
MVYPIVVYGDPVLKKKGIDIEVGSEEVKTLALDMFETMTNANGVGLAAPQIGKSLRMFIVDASAMEDEEAGDFKQVFINPEMILEDGQTWMFEEGCLSIPEIRENIERKEKVRIKYYDENWNLKEEEFTGIIARIIQHEYDHVEGILFTDHLTPLKRRLLKGKLSNISKGKVETTYRILAPMAKV